MWSLLSEWSLIKIKSIISKHFWTSGERPKRNHILCNHLLAGLYLTLEKEPNEVEQNWKQLQVGRIISFQFYNYLMFQKVIVYVLRAICSILKTITLRWHFTTLKRGGARLTKSVSCRWKFIALYPIHDLNDKDPTTLIIWGSRNIAIYCCCGMVWNVPLSSSLFCSSTISLKRT